MTESKDPTTSNNVDAKLLRLVNTHKTIRPKCRRLVFGRACKLAAKTYSGENYVAVMTEWCALAGRSYY